jgi:hypothetical protein
MEARITALLLVSVLAATPVRCFGQKVQDFSDFELSREQWQQRVDEARQRTEEFVAKARNGGAMPSLPYQEEIEALERAMRDPTLQQGDIVVTGKGLLLFTGRDEKHQPSDFILAPSQPR